MEENTGYSPEVLEILNRKPAWIIRWGILLITVLFIIGLAGSWFIPYSENLSAPVVMKHQVTGNGSTSFAGIIRIIRGDKKFVKPGQQVIVSILSDGSLSPVSLEGKVNSIMPDSIGSAFSAEIIIPGNLLSGLPVSSGEIPATVRITVGRSNLLEQIFRPIRSMFSSSTKRQ